MDLIRITIITKRTARAHRAVSDLQEVECKEAKKHLDPEALTLSCPRFQTKWLWEE